MEKYTDGSGGGVDDEFSYSVTDSMDAVIINGNVAFENGTYENSNGAFTIVLDNNLLSGRYTLSLYGVSKEDSDTLTYGAAHTLFIVE